MGCTRCFALFAFYASWHLIEIPSDFDLNIAQYVSVYPVQCVYNITRRTTMSRRCSLSRFFSFRLFVCWCTVRTTHMHAWHHIHQKSISFLFSSICCSASSSFRFSLNFKFFFLLQKSISYFEQTQKIEFFLFWQKFHSSLKHSIKLWRNWTKKIYSRWTRSSGHTHTRRRVDATKWYEATDSVAPLLFDSNSSSSWCATRATTIWFLCVTFACATVCASSYVDAGLLQRWLTAYDRPHSILSHKCEYRVCVSSCVPNNEWIAAAQRSESGRTK